MKNKIILFTKAAILLGMFLVAAYISGGKSVPDSMATVRQDRPTSAIILDESTPLSDNISSPSMVFDLFNLINDYRKQNNLRPLVWSADLVSCGDIRAKESSINWSHTRPDGSPWYTVNEAIIYGENLAKNYSSPQALLNAWIASPAHNENLLCPDFKYIGIGSYNDIFYAAEFCY